MQRIIPVIFIMAIIGLIIAVIVTVARVVFTSEGTSSEEIDYSYDALVMTAADSKVRMTVRGPIVGNDEFRSYQVSITPSSRDFVRYKGYLETPIGSRHYSNNNKAYDEFVQALAKAGLADGVPLEGEADDTTGVCAKGQIHEYEIISGDNVVKRLWTSTCDDIAGSLDASDSYLRGLFLAQVPDAEELIGSD